MVAIIFVLIGVLLPALGLARTQARTFEGLTNLSEISEAISMYAADHENTLPPGLVDEAELTLPWTQQLQRGYLPGADAGDAESANTNPLFHCPNATYPNAGESHYSAHPVLMPDRSINGTPIFALYKTAWLQRPSEVMLVADGAQRPDADRPYTAAPTLWRLDAPEYVADAPYYDPNALDNDDPINPGPNRDAGGSADGTVRWRQSGGTAANMLFVDGHTETLTQGKARRRHVRVDK